MHYLIIIEKQLNQCQWDCNELIQLDIMAITHVDVLTKLHL